MEKENIITINQTNREIEFNWMIKRYLPNFKDGEPTIIGVQFPWKRIFNDDNSLEETSQIVIDLFNDFVKGDFFKSINYTPQYRDIFLLKANLFSSYYWIEFIFTKNKWNLKTKGYSWEKESFIFSLGNNRDNDFIVSKIDYKISSEASDIERSLKSFDQRKFKLPIYTNEESFENSDYIFLFSSSDGMRRDHRLRGVDLLIDKDFDYFLHIDSNEYCKTSGKEINHIQQGQTPQNIIFQLLKIITENKYHQTYGHCVTDLPSSHFMFKINNKIHQSSIISWVENPTLEFKRLERLENTIEKWVDKIVEFQKQN